DFGLLFAGDDTKKLYARYGWVQITGRKFIRTEQGKQLVMPEEGVKMYYSLTGKDFPTAIVNLQGDEW
ncbi:unnamed protein product, partial [marine sediment metagenome]